MAAQDGCPDRDDVELAEAAAPFELAEGRRHPGAMKTSAVLQLGLTTIRAPAASPICCRRMPTR